MIGRASIAVVTPVYNGEKSIRNSIYSLLCQTFTDWISIIVNDGSTDNTEDILNEYRCDDRFIIIHFKKNCGRGHARQAALEKIRKIGAKYMCMLDADDIYYPDKLLWQYEFMEAHKDISLMSTSIGVTNKNGSLLSIIEPFSEETYLTFTNYMRYQKVPHACSIIRIKDVGQINFNVNLNLIQDQDFMRRFLVGKKYVFYPRMSYIYSRDESFSVEKHARSSYYAIKAVDDLDIPRHEKIVFALKKMAKVWILRILVLFGKRYFYMKQMGRKPTKSEVAFLEKVYEDILTFQARTGDVSERN